MISAFTASGVLPPFSGQDATDPLGVSPYTTTMTALVSRFGTSQERLNILAGLLDYRDALRQIGIVDGYQWFDGSFVEDVERVRGLPPKDIDIVTFAYRPTLGATLWSDFFNQNQQLFNPIATKATYLCDAYYVDLDMRPNLIVDRTTYWFGLLTHQRDTSLWKGLLTVPLASDDKPARLMI